MADTKAAISAAWKENVYPALKTVAYQLLSFSCGLLFSRGIVFSKCAPFGAAAVAAVPQKTVWAAVMGALFGYLMPGSAWVPARYMAAVLAAAAIRWTLSDLMKFRNHAVFAPIVSLLPILTTGLAVVGVNGSSADTVVITVAESILGGGSSFFMARTSILFENRFRWGEKPVSEKLLTSQDSACVVLTIGIALMCLTGAKPGSFSLGHVLAVLGILFASAYGGAAGGSIAGAASGVFFSLAGSGLSYISAGYAMGGLVAGIFAPGGRLACTAAFVISNGVAALQMGNTTLVLTGMYEVMAATVMFLLIPEKAGRYAVDFLRSEGGPIRSEGLRHSVVLRLDHAAKALEDVSHSMAQVSEKLRLSGALDIKNVFKRAETEACRNCGMQIFCREKGEENDWAELAKSLRKNGYVRKEEIFPRCVHPEEMAAALNRSYSEFTIRELAETRSEEIRKLVTDQFRTVGSILENMAGELELYDYFDEAAAGKVRDVLRSGGLLPLEVSCRTDRFGRMQIEAETNRAEQLQYRKSDLTERISRVCGRQFASPSVHKAGENLRMVWRERTIYRAQVGVCQHICGGNRLCGDSWESFEDGNGRQFLIVSDGMGTGGRAAVDGTMASGILMGLLRAGIHSDPALKIVNAALMAKSGDESLATVDLCSIDLFTGELEISKAGAPVSFIRKGDAVLPTGASSLPAGILQDVHFQKCSHILEDGDIAVLVSDGAISAGSQWLIQELEHWEGDSAEKLAELLMKEALLQQKDSRDDDITIAVLMLQRRRNHPVAG